MTTPQNPHPHMPMFDTSAVHITPLLAAMGARLGAALVCVFLRDAAPGGPRLTHLWRADGGTLPEAAAPPQIEADDRDGPQYPRGMVTAVNAATLPPPLFAALDAMGVCSAAVLELSHHGAASGYLCFGEDERYRDWSTGDDAALLALAGLTAAVLTARSTLQRAGLIERAYAAIGHIPLRIEALHTLRRQAGHDPLTGVYARTHGLELLSAMLAGNPSVTFCYFDVDGLDYVIDTHGQAEGRRLLATIGAVAWEVREKDDLFARLGGAGFMLVLGGSALNRAYAAIRCIQQRLAAMTGSGGFSYALSFREGVCELSPDHGAFLDAILQDTDKDAPPAP